MSDPRHVSGAHPQAVLQAWGGPSLDIDLGGWLDHDARAFEAALGTTRLLIVPTGHAELLAWQKKAPRTKREAQAFITQNERAAS